MKNIFLEAAMNYNKMSDLEKAEANDKIRENVKEIMKPRPKTEREKELDRLAKEEKEEYERNKNAFYADPIHWNNNKRRRHGLSVLRGSVNKYRSKKYPAFYPSVKFFGRLDDIITETLEDNFKNNEYFNSFVEEKNLAVGDANVFRVSKYESNNMELSQDERQKFLELIDKVSPCAAISEKENLEKFKEWLDSDMSKRVTFVDAPKIFKDQVGNDKVFLIPTNDEAIKPIRVIFEGRITV